MVMFFHALGNTGSTALLATVRLFLFGYFALIRSPAPGQALQPRAAADKVCSADPPQAQMPATESQKVILFVPECAQLALKRRRRPKS